jgi:hypothetical protein
LSEVDRPEQSESAKIPEVAELPEKVEKGLKSLVRSVLGMFFAIAGICFFPRVVARKSVNGESYLPGPLSLLALMTFLFNRVARAVMYVVAIFALALKSCSQDDELISTKAPEDLTDYVVAQMRWPSADDILLRSLPIVFVVLGLIWIGSRITHLKRLEAKDRQFLTQGSCYLVGAQCVIVAPVSTLVFSLLLWATVASHNYSIAIATIAAIATLTIWPTCCMYHYLRAVYTKIDSHEVRRWSVRIALAIFSLAIATIPLATCIGLTYPLVSRDLSNEDGPMVNANLYISSTSHETSSADVFIAIENNTERPIFIFADSIRITTPSGSSYCGAILDQTPPKSWVTLSAHMPVLLHAVVTRLFRKIVPPSKDNLPFGVPDEEMEEMRRESKCQPDIELPGNSKTRLYLERFASRDYSGKDEIKAQFNSIVGSGYDLDTATAKSADDSKSLPSSPLVK